MNIERLKSYMRRMVDFQNCGDCELNTVCEHGGECVFLTVREALAKVPEWIPVTERVPEVQMQDDDSRYGVSDVVLIWAGDVKMVRYITDQGKTWWIDSGGTGYWPTYWMKLPEPPEPPEADA